ncbi:MAG: S41 family peptidase [Flavobacteriales bacterium]|jgi:carboxyl-terminal processing protease|nr:S41 family peptidase [Flavobacteriales bacterium]
MTKYISLFTALLLYGSSLFGQHQSDKTVKHYTQKVEELIKVLDKKYVQEVDKSRLIKDFVIGTQNRLVPFHSYISAQKWGGKHDEVVVAGIGIAFKFKSDTILVDSVLSNSGAESSGIKKGDKIIKIGGHKISHYNYFSDVAKDLIGVPGSSLELTLANVEDSSANFVKSVERKLIDGIHFFSLGESITSIKDAIALCDTLYEDTVTNLKITETGIRYMLEHLDPHTAYISLEDLHDMNAPLKGSFTGVGVRFQIVKDTIVVVEAIPGGPSEKVGIQPGDKYIFIGEEKVAGVGIKNGGVRDRLLGDKGTKVAVKMKRTGNNELLDFTIERDKIPIYSVDASYMVTNEIGYIKVNKFSATTVMEVRKAMLSLKSQGMKSLVLDLQGNGGGYLSAAIGLADEFLSGDKLVVYTEGRAYPKQEYNTRYTGLMEEGKLVVLVNENSASASEIVSGAVQDWDRGLIVGRRTFGKGLVQKPHNLSDGTQVRITTSHYYTPAGRCIQKPYDKGIQEYRKEKYNRYKNGEYFHKDSIKFDESLKTYTKIKERVVYGGGGVMPDVFVPLDTLGTSDYFSGLIRKGIMNRFALTWVNSNRQKLQDKYITFDRFDEKFKIEKLTKELIKYAETEGLPFNKKQYEESKEVIKIRLKANVAQNLYDFSKFYQVNNALNDPLQIAIKLIESGEAFNELD